MSERKRGGCSFLVALLTCTSSTKNSTARQIHFPDENQGLGDTLTGQHQIQPEGANARGGRGNLSSRPLVQIRAEQQAFERDN